MTCHQGADNTLIDCILVPGMPGLGSKENDIFRGEGAVSLDEVLVNRELVDHESSGLVRAQDGDTSQLFNGSDTGDNGLVLGKLLGTDCEGDGQDSGHSNGDTTDQEHKDVVLLRPQW